MDLLDKGILKELQHDATLSIEDLAARLLSSKTPIWNRIQKLRQMGLIKAQVALLDPEKLGLEACFFVLIRTSEHGQSWQNNFLLDILKFPEILEAHRLAGDIDYLLKVRVKNARAYDRFYQKLIQNTKIFSVTALLSMEEIKYTTELPIE